MRTALFSVVALGLALAACQGQDGTEVPAAASDEPISEDGRSYLSQPLVSEIYTADPSAHVFDGKIYVYPSHDIDAGIGDDDLGNQYAMRDYRVLRMDRIGGPVTIGPVALDVDQVPWASQQMWAPDAAYKDGTYYLYFPARDKTRLQTAFMDLRGQYSLATSGNVGCNCDFGACDDLLSLRQSG